MTSTLEEILDGELFLASDFPLPTADEQRGPRTSASSGDPLALALDEEERSEEDEQEDEQEEDKDEQEE